MTEHFVRGLQLSIDAAVALLQPAWVPRNVEMKEIVTVTLQIYAFPSGVGCNQDSKRMFLRVRIESAFNFLFGGRNDHLPPTFFAASGDCLTMERGNPSLGQIGLR